MKKKANEYIKITVGMSLVAIGLYFFLMPKNLSVGGANGLAIVINHFIPNLSIGLLMIIINIFLFAIGFIFIGTNFGFKTIYASFGVSVRTVLSAPTKTRPKSSAIMPECTHRLTLSTTPRSPTASRNLTFASARVPSARPISSKRLTFSPATSSRTLTATI